MEKLPDARDPEVNPFVAIELHTRDGVVLRFTLDKPVSQFDGMIWLGHFLGKTGQAGVNLELPEPLQ